MCFFKVTVEVQCFFLKLSFSNIIPKHYHLDLSQRWLINPFWKIFHKKLKSKSTKVEIFRSNWKMLIWLAFDKEKDDLSMSERKKITKFKTTNIKSDHMFSLNLRILSSILKSPVKGGGLVGGGMPPTKEFMAWELFPLNPAGGC